MSGVAMVVVVGEQGGRAEERASWSCEVELHAAPPPLPQRRHE